MHTAPVGESERFRLLRAPAPAVVPWVPDDAQRQVLEHDRGPLRVVGGPGTGKTATLVAAVVDRVRSRGADPATLLALTFSRDAAVTLRDAAALRLGGAVGDPMARTFHSYAFGLIRRAAVLRGDPPPRLLSSSEQNITLRELLAGRLERRADEWPTDLLPALRTRAFVDELSDLLMRAVERGLDADDLRVLGWNHNRPDWIVAADVLAEYLEVTALKSPGAFDAPELMQQAIDALASDPELLASERAQRRRIFVDDYADTDPGQRALLRVIARGCDELVVFGDPDSSIYFFRGADHRAMDAVESDLGLAADALESVVLRTPHRSSSQLTSATGRIAARLSGARAHRIAPPTAPSPVPSDAATVATFASASHQAAFLAAALRRAHLEDGVPFSRMAVLVRSPGESAESLRRSLSGAGVPVEAPVAGTLVDDPVVVQLLLLLRLVRSAADLDDDAAADLLTGPIGRADPLQLLRIRRHLDRAGRGEWGLSVLLSDRRTALVLPDTAGAPVRRVLAVADAGRAVAEADGSPEDVLWAVWEASGLSSQLERRSLAGGADGGRADRDLDAVLALFGEAAQLSDRSPGSGVAQLEEWVGQLQIAGTTADPRSAAAEAVQILSAHAAKGREWDVVCVPFVQEGTWPGLRRRGSLLGADLLVDLLADRPPASSATLATLVDAERRLFYVAATRARRRLLVTAVDNDDLSPSRFLDELDPVEGERRPLRAAPVRFELPGVVAELRAALLDADTGDADRDEAARQLALLGADGVAGADPDQWWGLADVSSDGPLRPVGNGPVPIRPSAVQTYLDCELKALFRELGAVDASDNTSAALGTLIHAIAEQIADDPRTERAMTLLDEGWSSLEFPAPWLDDQQRRRARAMLTTLVDWARESRQYLTLVGVEVPFRVTVGDAQLSGTVDRLERDPDGRLVVVDIKTGRTSQTRKQASEHAQLASYQLAVDEGGFADVAGDDAQSGGGLLLQVATTAASLVRSQPAMSDPDSDATIRTDLARIAGVLRGSSVTARVGAACQNCPVRGNCPADPHGRQVTG